MLELKKILEKYQNHTLALYGLGTETERFLSQYSSQLSITGLLDSFRDSGELYGYPIIPLSDLPSHEVSLIIVIARPGSCKAIAKRVGGFCLDHGIALFDVRGKNLLEPTAVSYDFSSVQGYTIEELYGRINSSNLISFDLFDTLVMRKVKSYTDVFDLVDHRLREGGIFIPDFSKTRIYAEKELSKTAAPRLLDIYELVLKTVGGSFITASELAALEWEIDCSLFTVRDAVREVFNATISAGKTAVITTDSYYSKEQIAQILDKLDISGYDDLFVSCEYGTAKPQRLFDVVKQKYTNSTILHIGDDEYADVEKAEGFGISTFRIYSARDLFDFLGGLGVEDYQSLSDRIKVGLFLSHVFNSPFRFECGSRGVSVGNSFDIGFLFCAPVITDFTIWLKEKTLSQSYMQILFGARDGYLIGRLFQLVEKDRKAFYFLTSRTAAIRTGIETEEDIEYVDGMKYSGSPVEALKVRYGIEVENSGAADKSVLILSKARKQRENYKLYIEKLGLEAGNIAFFDFVAKGTTQMYIQRLFKDHMKGFYFLQLEPEFMADKGIDIEPFYSDEEKNTSAIFDNYYILETVLTSPYPQILEMDDNGRPVFAAETRCEDDIEVFKRTQEGVTEYFKDYISITPESVRTVNKELDEKLLELINKVQILDDDFLSIKVEDPFFGRMTDIRDVIG